MKRMPPELMDMIIDHLHDHKRTLASLSTICKAWLATSRYHLFRRITVYATKQDSVEELERWIRFLDASPSVRSYIKVLDLRGSQSPTRARTFFLSCGAKIDAPILSSIIQRLPSLSILRLSSFLFSATTTSAAETSPKLLDQAFSLDELSIDNVKGAPESTDDYEIAYTLIRIIGLFRQINTLRSARIQIHMPQFKLAENLQMISSYTCTHGKMRISAIEDIIIPGWPPFRGMCLILTRLLDPSFLHSASVQCYHPEDLLCITKLLGGHVIESLSLSMFPAFWQLSEQSFEGIDLRACRSLQSVELNVDRISDAVEGSDRDPLGLYFAILFAAVGALPQSVTSLKLNASVHMVSTGEYLSSLRSANWARFDTHLTTNFPHLQEVRITLIDCRIGAIQVAIDDESDVDEAEHNLFEFVDLQGERGSNLDAELESIRSALLQTAKRATVVCEAQYD